ncbi:MAG: RHS repeat-associated core domain-containing protein [Pseudomonadota bacterium]
MFRNNKFFAIHSDHLGSPRLMTNDLNVAVWQWPYSAFGETKPTGVLRATPNPNVAITNQPVLLRATAATEMNLRFPGQYADIEAGNFYNYLREYDAATGRYRQSDPIGLGGGLNRFGYVGGNALGATDPMGLKKIILLKPDDPNYPAAVNEPDDPSTCLVISHGSNQSVSRMNASQLNKLLNKQGCTPKQPVKLDACRTGQGDNSIAEQLARLRKSTVIAPDDRTWTTPWGSSISTPYPPVSEDPASVWNGIPNWSQPGNWRTFDGSK